MNTVKLKLEKKVLLYDKLYHLYLSPVDVSKIEFEAGQYFAILVGEGVKRFYSIASAPSDPYIEFLISTAPGGPGSKFCEEVKEGDTIDVVGPIGRFTFRSMENAVFVATGTGVAPFRSMIKDQLVNGNPNQLQLLFGVRLEENLFLQNEFEMIARQYANFKFTPTLSQPTENWKGERGRVTEYLQNMKIDETMDFYLCGIKEMIDDAKQVLTSHGVAPEKIFTEMY